MRRNTKQKIPQISKKFHDLPNQQNIAFVTRLSKLFLMNQEKSFQEDSQIVDFIEGHDIVESSNFAIFQDKQLHKIIAKVIRCLKRKLNEIKRLQAGHEQLKNCQSIITELEEQLFKLKQRCQLFHQQNQSIKILMTDLEERLSKNIEENSISKDRISELQSYSRQQQFQKQNQIQDLSRQIQLKSTQAQKYEKLLNQKNYYIAEIQSQLQKIRQKLICSGNQLNEKEQQFQNYQIFSQRVYEENQSLKEKIQSYEHALITKVQKSYNQVSIASIQQFGDSVPISQCSSQHQQDTLENDSNCLKNIEQSYEPSSFTGIIQAIPQPASDTKLSKKQSDNADESYRRNTISFSKKANQSHKKGQDSIQKGTRKSNVNIPKKQSHLKIETAKKSELKLHRRSSGSSPMSKERLLLSSTQKVIKPAKIISASQKKIIQSSSDEKSIEVLNKQIKLLNARLISKNVNQKKLISTNIEMRDLITQLQGQIQMKDQQLNEQIDRMNQQIGLQVKKRVYMEALQYKSYIFDLEEQCSQLRQLLQEAEGKLKYFEESTLKLKYQIEKKIENWVSAIEKSDQLQMSQFYNVSPIKKFMKKKMQNLNYCHNFNASYFNGQQLNIQQKNLETAIKQFKVTDENKLNLFSQGAKQIGKQQLQFSPIDSDLHAISCSDTNSEISEKPINVKQTNKSGKRIKTQQQIQKQFEDYELAQDKLYEQDQFDISKIMKTKKKIKNSRNNVITQECYDQITDALNQFDQQIQTYVQDNKFSNAAVKKQEKMGNSPKLDYCFAQPISITKKVADQIPIEQVDVEYSSQQVSIEKHCSSEVQLNCVYIEPIRIAKAQQVNIDSQCDPTKLGCTLTEPISVLLCRRLEQVKMPEVCLRKNLQKCQYHSLSIRKTLQKSQVHPISLSRNLSTFLISQLSICRSLNKSGAQQISITKKLANSPLQILTIKRTLQRVQNQPIFITSNLQSCEAPKSSSNDAEVQCQIIFIDNQYEAEDQMDDLYYEPIQINSSKPTNVLQQIAEQIESPVKQQQYAKSVSDFPFENNHTRHASKQTSAHISPQISRQYKNSTNKDPISVIDEVLVNKINQDKDDENEQTYNQLSNYDQNMTRSRILSLPAAIINNSHTNSGKQIEHQEQKESEDSSENKSENNSENNSGNNSEKNSENISENNSENNIVNNSENNIVNNSEKSSEKNSENISENNKINNNAVLFKQILSKAETRYIQPYFAGNKYELGLFQMQYKQFQSKKCTWDINKIYILECMETIRLTNQTDKIILCKRGLYSINTNKYANACVKFPKRILDPKLFILGNCEIVVNKNLVKFIKASDSKKAEYFGDLEGQTWRINKITSYTIL